ncbi:MULTISPECIES: methyl-accepting chemotaxis protein [unclassified Bacillus (in: firmicutes)]|uniref:methyl-accepting chemotaxis protein n=1 Tax=unclassified Bacillus (in: firmicutes) TaxID=185979 RepID=UPI0008E49E4C|nr:MULTISPECIES: HAMP domain-containing methyl-accepting chemotaxis protein [unclassified Bacillus (in: firmicutes)]SFA77648.1 methyl-accepting chemotaxis protein [Bacillus sp. UNCCL13]SFQ67566.1 methyl-accepting chemotaxis protein [Bacillus sp. cl95]
MNLRKKLLLNSLIPLILAILMVGFIIAQMMQIQSANKSEVKNLVNVQRLDGDVLSLQQGLGTFAFSPSDANAYVVTNVMNETRKIIGELNENLTDKDHLKQLDKINTKFTQLEKESKNAIQAKSDFESKRLSLRTKGILNDLYYLKKITNETYESNQLAIKKQIGFVITSALLGSLILLAVTGVITFIYTTRITSPIKKLAENANRIAEGDLTVKLESISLKDEVGQLNEAFIQMAGNLKKMIEHLAISSEQVASSSQQLAASAEQTIATTEQMSRTMQEVAAGSDHQLKMSLESAQAVEETTIGITRIAESATQLSELTSDTVSKAEEGSTFVGKTVQQMTTIQQSVDITDERVRLLSNRSKEIDDIVGIITAIAGQTNLLALNAAIEAARAGESGKGFAVVADEVRKLAEETNTSAKKIGNIVNEVQRETDLSVQAMEDVRQNVEEGIQITEDTRSKFAEILASMDRMSAQIEEISATSEEISAGSEEVAASVQDMAEVARQSSSHTQVAASSAGEQLASMDEINQSVNQLSKMATELENIIGTFKMD